MGEGQSAATRIEVNKNVKIRMLEKEAINVCSSIRLSTVRPVKLAAVNGCPHRRMLRVCVNANKDAFAAQLLNRQLVDN